jgi:hypothetical protein
MKLELWGYSEGRAGTENKHELPPPIDSVLIFGDAVLVATNEIGEPQNFTTEKYTKFYTAIFQGFESLDEDEDDEEDEEDEEELETETVEEEEEEIIEPEVEEEEVPEAKPVAKVYASARNKKIPKWAMATELEEEEYLDI